MLAFRTDHAHRAADPNEPRARSRTSREDEAVGRPYRRVLALVDLTARGAAILEHARRIAVKNRSAMVAVHVIDSQPWFDSDGPAGQFLPEERLFFKARAAARKLDLFLARNNAPWAESAVLYGKTNEALATLIGRWKPDVIVADARAARRAAVARALASVQQSMQVLALERAQYSRYAAAGDHSLLRGTQLGVAAGESETSAAEDPARRRQMARTLLLGAMTGTLYWLMFANERAVLDFSAKGHWHFIAPLAIALVFSFVHGAFTAEFWDTLGVKPNRRH